MPCADPFEIRFLGDSRNMKHDTDKNPPLEELTDDDIVPDDIVETPSPDLEIHGDVTPVIVDQCRECGHPLLRISEDLKPPASAREAWGRAQCVATRDGWWRWCWTSGWLHTENDTVHVNYERRVRSDGVDGERRTARKPAAR